METDIQGKNSEYILGRLPFMELVWQTNGFQECQLNLHSKMHTVDNLFFLLLQPGGGQRFFHPGQGPSLSTHDALPPLLLAPYDGQEGVSHSHLCMFFLPFLLDVFSKKITNSCYIRNLRCKPSS